MKKLEYLKTFESFSIETNNDETGVNESSKETFIKALTDGTIDDQNPKQDVKKDFEKANMYFSRFTSDRNKDLIKGAVVYVSEEGDSAAISFPGAHPKPRQYVFALFFSLKPAPYGVPYPTSAFDSPHKTLPTCELFITKHEENYNKQVKAIVRKYNLESRLDNNTDPKQDCDIDLTGLDLSIIENIVRDLNKL